MFHRSSHWLKTFYEKKKKHIIISRILKIKINETSSETFRHEQEKTLIVFVVG